MIDRDYKPQIRFVGFCEDWKQHKIKDICNYFSSNLSVADLNPNGEFELYDANGVIGKTNKLLQKEEYITIIKDGSGVGRVRKNSANSSFIGTMGAIVPNGSNIDYLFAELQRKDFTGHINGATIPHIYFSSYGEDDIYTPKIEEQQKIGTYFECINHVINLHENKYKKLINIKKSMLDKMFPQNDNNIPEIRFNGFVEKWEQHKLSEFLERRQIYQRITNDVPRLAFAAGQGVIPLSERKTNNRDQLISDEATKKYLLTEYNDLVYNPANLKYGAIDRNKYGKGVISPIYVTFTTTEVPSFVERIITSERFKLKALQFEEGTVVKRQSVSPERLLLLEEYVSSNKNEQEQIGLFFDTLDHLIILQQQKLEKLKNIKKSMLEKMFVK